MASESSMVLDGLAVGVDFLEGIVVFLLSAAHPSLSRTAGLSSGGWCLGPCCSLYCSSEIGSVWPFCLILAGLLLLWSRRGGMAFLSLLFDAKRFSLFFGVLVRLDYLSLLTLASAATSDGSHLFS